MKMDAETQLFLKYRKIFNLIPVRYLPISLIRKLAFYGYKTNAIIKNIQNITIPGPHGDIPLRIYIPLGAGPFPVLVAFHGGGWVIGTLDNYDGFCREICSFANIIVVSVEYRRAPEHRFPVPLEDCYSATTWVANNIHNYNGNPNQLVVSGESAGGNLAAAVALMARDKQGPRIALQMLMYPVTDYACNTESHRKFARGYLLASGDMHYMWNLYLRNEKDKNNPYASVLRAKDVTNLPPAFIVLAAFDPLHDEGYAYAQKLQEAQVKTMVLTYPTIHGFLNFKERLSIGKQGVQDIVQYLKMLFF